MSSNFYTNVQSFGGKILFRGVINGKRVKQKIDYGPTLYVPSKNDTKFRTLSGSNLAPKKFDDIKQARDFLKQFEDLPGAPKIYGQNRFEYAFIAEQYRGMVDYDQDKISVAFIDIEVGSENGFPDPYEANEPITAICIEYLNGKTWVFACGDYDKEKDKENDTSNVTYVKCKDEYSLCKQFLELWKSECPDVLTGWNTKFFDIPYLVNRFTRILGEQTTKGLSPWNFITERKVNVNHRQMIDYTLVGVSSLDYIELYKWYAPGGKSQESYRLDNIAQIELGEGKLSYDEYDNLHALYRLDHQKFIEYNIKDVRLVLKLEDKLKLVEMALTLGYDTKCNYEDVFAQTRMWDSLTYAYLYEKNIIVPPRSHQSKDSAFEGNASMASAPLGAWLGVLWQSWGNTLFGYAAWGWLLSKHPAALVAPTPLLVPIFGMGASAYFLSEPLPTWKILAAGLVIAGLVVNLFWPSLESKIKRHLG